MIEMIKKPKTPFEQWLNYLKYQRRNCVDTIKFNDNLFNQILKVKENDKRIRDRKQESACKEEKRKERVVEMADIAIA
jgi:ASC-1-like (ASCH) protein